MRDVRLAVMLLLACWMAGAVRGDDEDSRFRRVELDDLEAYIVPAEYAVTRKTEFESTIPGPVKITDFWTPGETSAIVADRVLRIMIHRAMKDPTLLFPDLAPNPAPDAAKQAEEEKAAELEKQRRELELVSENYADYARQYVGVIVAKQRLVFCNYAAGTRGDAALEYLFTEKFFEAGGRTHFLQCRFDPEAKECSNVSMIGPWDTGRDD